jgi:hypothetical protein
LGAAVVALILALILGLGSSPSSLTPTTGNHAATTSAPPTTTTTTTVPSAPTALAALVRDIAAGESAGSIDSGQGQSISNSAQKAVTDQAAGHADQAANDLQQTAMSIANGAIKGTISPTEAATLQSDLSALAGTLGLSSAAAPPTTTTPPTTATPAPAPGPGPGGHGKDKVKGP